MRWRRYWLSLRRLRSASTEQLDVPTCRRSTIGGRAFPVAGAKVWNGLPNDVTSASSLSVFKNRPKTYLFRRCYETVWFEWHFLFLAIISPPQNSGLCNSFYCLSHSKNVLMMVMMTAFISKLSARRLQIAIMRTLVVMNDLLFVFGSSSCSCCCGWVRGPMSCVDYHHHATDQTTTTKTARRRSVPRLRRVIETIRKPGARSGAKDTVRLSDN